MKITDLRTRTLFLALTVGFVALALLVTVVVLRQVLVTETAVVTDRSLRTQGQELSRLLSDADRQGGESQAELAGRVLATYYEAEVTSSNKTMTLVVDGRTVATEGPELVGLSPSVTELVGAAGVDQVALLDGQAQRGPLRVLARPVQVAPDQTDGHLLIALSTEEQSSFITRAFRDAIIVAGATLLLIVPLAWLVAGRFLRPIELLADTAQDITAHQLSQRLPEQGTAEIAHLIESFNAMVDRLEGAVQEQRRFLNDASHELRTPLTVMRGHLEVARQNPERAIDASSVALTELDRMGRIVDDLLVLARSKQIGFLRFGPVDSDDFLTSIMARVSGMSDHRWVIDAMPLGVLRADLQRLDQIMLNLCVNAARHTPTGGEIGIGAELATDHFRMWVRDTGEGIDPSEHQQIFERFHRGTSNRASGGGAGLGLSIVRAIAEGHGGSVSVESVLGEGSLFTVVIPTEPAELVAG
jgi:signal transduction histidine kinase